jgi:hypothetical protein
LESWLWLSPASAASWSLLKAADVCEMLDKRHRHLATRIGKDGGKRWHDEGFLSIGEGKKWKLAAKRVDICT